MRIISGIYKGRNLLGYNIDGTRPTMSRVKESLFAMIQNKLKDSVILDLFAGSGNLGIEALSNGSSEAYFVDKNKIAYKTILDNLKTLNIESAKVFNMDYKDALNKFFEDNISFDLIFLDPPYGDFLINPAIEIIEKNNLLKSDGYLVCETEIEEIECNYTLIKEKKYGSKIIKIYKR